MSAYATAMSELCKENLLHEVLKQHDRAVAAEALIRGLYERRPVVVKEGWDKAGRRGVTLGIVVFVNEQSWMPVLWDDEEDPDFIKTAALADANDNKEV